MRLSLALCQQVSTRVLDTPPPGRLKLDVLNPRWHKDKVVIVMGATGTGKSRLSIDLATRFPAEIINSDKMQVYKGLDIVTNKVNEQEMCGIPHHLLGSVNPNLEFTMTNFCDAASLATDSILSQGLLPIIVGGSNSYIEALVDGSYGNFGFRSKYDFCFLWIGVSLPVLHNFVSERVDRMFQNGLVDEVRDIFDPFADYSQGIRKSIGVPELDRYLIAEQFNLREEIRARLLHEAICDIKNNTCKLACRQFEKIRRLRNIKGWKIHRINATEVFRRRGKEADEAWERIVAGPSIAIVREFLCGFSTNNVPSSTKALLSEECFAQLLVS